MARVLGVLESSLYVRDIDRAIAFYRDTLRLQLVEEFEEKRGAAFMAGPTILLLFDAAKSRRDGLFPPHGAEGRGHVALQVEASELDEWRTRLREHSVAIE